MNDHADVDSELVANVPDIAFQRFTLDNGLTLLVHEDHRMPTVAVHIGYGVGAKDEPKGMFGFAHLMEHVMFSGSAALPGSYITHLEQAGSQGLNGVTNADMTQFFQSVPVGSLDFTLFAESDRMGSLLTGLQPEALNVQRDVVTREMEEDELQPYGSVQGVILRHLFPAEHPYAHRVAGEREDLQKVDFTQVTSWISRFYRPNNAVITLAGDITAEQALEKVGRYFGHIPAGEPLEQCRRWLPQLQNERRVTVQDRVDSTLLRICWVIPPYDEQGVIALELFAGVLADTAESILIKRLMVEQSLAADVSAFIETGTLASYFNLRIMLQPSASALEVERIAQQALTDILSMDIDAELLQYSQYTQLQAAYDTWSDNLSLAAELGKYEMYPCKAEGVQQRVKLAMSMGPDDVLAAAREWLGDGRLVLTVEPYPYRHTALPSSIPRTPPAIKIAPMKQVASSQHVVLSNGLRVVQSESDDSALLSLSLIINAGAKYDPSGEDGLANLVAGLVCSSETFQQQMQQYNVMYDIDVTAESVALRMQIPVSNSEAVLALLAETMCVSQLSDELIHAHQEYYLQMIPELDVVQWVLPAMTFPQEHPLRRPAFIQGSSQTMQNITVDSVQLFYQRYYQPQNATLMLHGSTPQSASLLEGLFDHWQSAERVSAPTVAIDSPSSEGSLILIDQPESSVTTLSAFFALPGRGGPDDAAVQLIYPLLAGSFGSRINFSMREVHRLTYNVVGLQYELPGVRLLGFDMVVAADSIVPSVRAICQEIHALLTSRPLTMEEMKGLAQGECLRLSKPINDYETLCQQEILLRQGLDENYWHSLMELMGSISVDEVNNVIKQYLLPEKGKWILQGDVSRYSNELASVLSLPAKDLSQNEETLYQ